MFVGADAAAVGLAIGLVGGTIGAAVAFAAAAVAVNLLDRRRAHELGMSALDDLPSLAARGVVLTGAMALLGLPAHENRLAHLPQVLHPVLAVALFVVIAAALRTGGYAILRRLHSTGRLVSPALIIGAGSVGAQLRRQLSEHPHYGIRPVGFVDSSRGGWSEPREQVLGGVADLPRLIDEHAIHHVFVAFSGLPDEDLVDLLRGCDRMHCEIFVVPRLFELGVSGSSPGEHVWGVPLVRLHRAAFRSRLWTVKRGLDVIVSAAGLVLGAPLLLAIALAVRLECGPGVLFRQVRVGLDGHLFRLIKFRSMRPAASGDSVTWSKVDDERVGPVGRFLRRSSLDELPQLWNVLRGHMSLVGPRPEQPRYVREFCRVHARYEHRLRVPAGLTGLSQVHDLRGATPIEDRVSIDNFYIEHWSLWQDVKILLRTVASVLLMRGH